MNQRHSMKLSVFRASTSWNSQRTQKHSPTAFSRRKRLHFYVCQSAHSVHAYGMCSGTNSSGYFPLAICGCCCFRLTCDGISWCLSLQQLQRYVLLLFCFEMIVHAEIKSVLMMMKKKEKIFDGTKIVIFAPFAAIQRNFVKCTTCLAVYILVSLSYNFI